MDVATRRSWSSYPSALSVTRQPRSPASTIRRPQSPVSSTIHCVNNEFSILLRLYVMLISVLCLELLAVCPHSAVGAPVRIATYGQSELLSNFWTQKQRPKHRCHSRRPLGHGGRALSVSRGHRAGRSVDHGRQLDWPSLRTSGGLT